MRDFDPAEIPADLHDYFEEVVGGGSEVAPTT